jgi:hypothetical protein
VRFVHILTTVAFIGCSALTSLDDLSQQGGDAANVDANGGDAGGNDANNGSDVVQTNDAGDASTGNLVTNPSFEQGQGGCGTNWGGGYSNTASRQPGGHTGNACVVCTNGANSTSFAFNQTTPVAVQPGNYYAEAWMETPYDGGVAVASPGVGIQIVYAGDGGLSGCIGSSTLCQGSFVTSGSWTLSTTTFVVSGSGTLQVVAHAYDGTAGSCFAWDDVALYAQ